MCPDGTGLGVDEERSLCALDGGDGSSQSHGESLETKLQRCALYLKKKATETYA